jgi:hypothetical protein
MPLSNETTVELPSGCDNRFMPAIPEEERGRRTRSGRKNSWICAVSWLRADQRRQRLSSVLARGQRKHVSAPKKRTTTPQGGIVVDGG